MTGFPYAISFSFVLGFLQLCPLKFTMNFCFDFFTVAGFPRTQKCINRMELWDSLRKPDFSCISIYKTYKLSTNVCVCVCVFCFVLFFYNIWKDWKSTEKRGIYDGNYIKCIFFIENPSQYNCVGQPAEIMLTNICLWF